MTRVLTVTLVTLVVGAFWQCFALILPTALNAFLLPPIILAFSLQYFRPFETVLLVFWCGAIVDILGGQPIGINMLLMLGFFFLLEASKLFSGRLSLRELSIYAGFLSLIYRLTFFFLEAIISGPETNVYLWSLAFGPLIDFLLSFPIYLLLLKILVALKVLDQYDALKKNLGTT